MKPWIHLDSAAIPHGGELHLWQHQKDFAIRVGRDELMNSQTHGSEEVLAERACVHIADRTQARVLIGGLGMGYTIAAALRSLNADAQITVAELVAAVVTWNRGPLAHLANNPLADERVKMYQGDVAALLRKAQGDYDAIILDVDNGPQALATQENQWLYSVQGLRSAHRALRSGGILAVWSTSPDQDFTVRLQKCGFAADTLRVPAHGTKGPRHTIWLATRA